MSEEEEFSPPSGTISLNVNDSAITWESTFSLPETVMWLDVLRTMLVTKIIHNES